MKNDISGDLGLCVILVTFKYLITGKLTPFKGNFMTTKPQSLTDVTKSDCLMDRVTDIIKIIIII